MLNSKILNREILNSKSRGLIDSFLLNSNGAIDPSSAGYQYVIDTLSFIRSKVIEQKFYEIPIAEYVPVEVGEAAFGSEVVQNLTFQTGGDFYAGDVNANPSQGRVSEVSAFLEPIRIPTQLWTKKTNWTTIEVKQAAAINKWDVIESRIKSLKKDWDLGIQETAFLGHPIISTMTGLINNASVTKNTTLISVPISQMTVAELKVLIQGLISAYWNNSNNTALPDTFLVPSADFFGLGDFVGDTTVVNPLALKIEVIENMFKKMTQNDKFKVKPLAYCQANRNSSRGINKDRYVLYKNDPDTLTMPIPIDFTMLAADTGDQLQWSQGSYGQYSGVLINRVPEVLYIDSAAPFTY
jgi:hypothetical protein